MGAYTKEKFLRDIKNPDSERRALQKLNGAMFHGEAEERLVPDVALAQKLLGVAETSSNPANRESALEVFETVLYVKPSLANNPDLARQVATISMTGIDAGVRHTAHQELIRILANNAEATSPATEAAFNVFKPYAAHPVAWKRFAALDALKIFASRDAGYAREVMALADDAATCLNGHIRRAAYLVREEILGRRPDLSSPSLAKDLARSAVSDPDDIARDKARDALEVLVSGGRGLGAVALAEVKAVIADPAAPRHKNYEMRRDEQKALGVIVRASPGLKEHAAGLVADGLKDHAVEVRCAAQEALQPREPERIFRSVRCRSPQW